MATIDRNGLVEALRSRLEDGLDGVKVTRRTRDPAPEELPCLIVGATTEQTNGGENQPDWTLRVGCLLFVKETGDDGPIPGILSIVDKVEGALLRQSTETHGRYWTDLGGVAWYARPESVDTLPDAEMVDQGIAMIRIEVRARPVR